MNLKSISWGRVIFLIFLAIGAIAASALIGISLQTIPEGRFTPEISLTILLIASIVAFLAIIIISAAIYSAVGLSDPTQAFGMPEGSVRAIVALSLLIIFSITSIFLYGRLRQPSGYTINGMTIDQANALPSDKILAKVPNSKDNNLFDITILYNNNVSDDFAKQILTTIGTLVVAVAGFYFGAKTSAATKKGSERPTLNIISPPSPARMEINNTTNKPKALPIIIETRPLGLSVESRINGKVDTSIKLLSHNEFAYEPDEILTDDKTITFFLSAYTDVRQSILIKAN